MLTVFYGTDELRTREAALAYVSSLTDKDPKAEVEKLEAESYDPGTLLNICDAISMFASTNIYLLDTPSLVLEYQQEVLSHVKELAESEHQFVMIEGALLAADKKILNQHALSVTEYKRGPQANFDAFKIADALARRDKRSLWLLLQEGIISGMAAEEIIGIVWWQLKTLRLASLTKNASEAGVKDFPYNKAKKALVSFKAGEVDKMSLDLLKLYHAGHSGKRDIDLALEDWVLRL